MSIHAHHKGRRVRTLDTIRGRGYAPDWPGWQAPDHLEHMPDLEPGWVGTITNVESHGANPWTRYGIEFDNGVSTNGIDPRHVEFLVGEGVNIARTTVSQTKTVRVVFEEAPDFTGAMGRRYRPTGLVIHYDYEEDGWRVSEATLTGTVYRKDGTLGVRRESDLWIEFGNTKFSTAPHYVRNLITKHMPKGR